jgi:hypothetical protein
MKEQYGVAHHSMRQNQILPHPNPHPNLQDTPHTTHLCEHGSSEHPAFHAQGRVLSVQTELLDLIKQDYSPNTEK